MESSGFGNVLLLSCALGLLAVCGGCSRPETAAPVAAEEKIARPQIHSCTLLTSAEIEAQQGEALQGVQETARDDALAISQCFFTLPTFTKSISLQVVSGKSAGAARAKWQSMFAPEKLEVMEREGGAPKQPPRRLDGIGDGAFWISGPAGGIYALAGEHYLFLSVGGPDDEETKIQKSTALARNVLARLSAPAP